MKMRSRIAAVAALILPLTGAMVLRETPITRVVTLLKDLSAKAEEDGKKEEDLYETFVCWAKSIIEAKTASNSAAEARIEELETYIKDIEAGRIEFTSERSDLEKELKSLNSEIEAAEALREKEHAEYKDAKEEMESALKAVDKAIDVLGKATNPKASQLLQQRSLATFSERQRDAADLSLASELASRMLSAGDAVFLRRLLTGDVPERADWKKLNRKATFKKSYKARSVKIQGILKDMKKTLEDNLQDAEDKEKETKKEFDALMEVKTQQKKDTEKALGSMEKETGARQLNKEEAAEELDALKEQVKNDSKYIEQTKTEAATKKKEFKARKQLRQEELAAFSKAIEILYNDDARDLMKKSYASQQGASFLQVDLSAQQRRRGASAARVLRAAAVASRDQRLAVVAARLAAGGHFTEVMGAIDKMVQALKSEEASDLEKKELCEKERMENTRDAATKSRAIDEATELVARLKGEIEEIDAAIAEKKETITKTNEELKEATELRKKENEEWKKSTADDEEMKTIIKRARGVLEKFYADSGLMLVQTAKGPESAGETGKAPPPPPPTWDGAYQGQTEESGNIIGILEMAEEDVAKDIATAKAAEDEAASDFKTYTAETEKALKGLAQAIGDLEQSKGEKEGDVHSTKSSRAGDQKELASVMKTIEDAEPGCSYLQANFPVRQQERQIESDGLRKAKAILSGGKFDAPDPDRELKPGDAFLQRRR